jgi:hypothetical protein
MKMRLEDPGSNEAFDFVMFQSVANECGGGIGKGGRDFGGVA